MIALWGWPRRARRGHAPSRRTLGESDRRWARQWRYGYAPQAPRLFRLQTLAGCRLKLCEDRQARGWSIQSSCAAEGPERRFDFRIGRHAAAIGFVDGAQFVGCRMIFPTAARARSVFELLNIFLGPGGDALKQFLGRRCHLRHYTKSFLSAHGHGETRHPPHSSGETVDQHSSGADATPTPRTAGRGQARASARRASLDAGRGRASIAAVARKLGRLPNHPRGFQALSNAAKKITARVDRAVPRSS